MGLMRGIALHNTLLIHQHSARRMDGGPHSPPDQQPPPPGFYQNILVRLNLALDKEVVLFRCWCCCQHCPPRACSLPHPVLHHAEGLHARLLPARVKQQARAIACRGLGCRSLPVQASLALSPEQREAMLAHRQIKLAALARLVQERREIQASLQVGREKSPVACASAAVRGTLLNNQSC